MDIFIKQISIINENNYNYYNPKNFDIFFKNPDKKKKILITIDDAFSSFYENAWPYLKENKIPFILFISTEPIGKYGYMNWDQIKEIEKEDFAFIGNHSHSHEYLVDYEFNDFKKDIDQSIEIFKKKLGYNPIFFSYPFGEYSLEQKNYIKQKFQYAFGQHSGVIDLTKDKFELPRFPINEKYGDLKRFKSVVDFLPFQYQSLFPEEKFITFDYLSAISKQLRMIGTVSATCEAPARPIQEAVNLRANGAVDLSWLVTHRLDFTEAATGYELYADKEDPLIKLVLKI